MDTIKQAQKLTSLIHQAAKDIAQANKYFGRKFDDIFEQGDSKHIVVEFIKLYNSDEKLQKAVEKVDKWIGIESWVKTYEKWEQQNPVLF